MDRKRTQPALREQVLATAQPLFAAGHSPSFDEVARAAGISRATLYRIFPSRDDLLQALDVEPEPESRERILAAALEMIGQRGLAALSMDELAEQADVSRATVYRLFPGKAALFREVVQTYTPFEQFGQVIEQAGSRPIKEVLTEIAALLTSRLAAHPGLFQTLALEMVGQQADTEEAVRFALGHGISALAGYLQQQMQRGVLRPMPPVLALQAFLGPLILHLMTRSLAERALGFHTSLEEAIEQFVAWWLRAMQPDQREPSA